MIENPAARIDAIEERVRRVENAMEAGLDEIKDLIRQEIRDLKSEQLADLKATIGRIETDLKGEHGRLADDQRRLWDAVRVLEKGAVASTASRRAISSLAHGVTSLFGAGIGSLITWLLTRR